MSQAGLVATVAPLVAKPVRSEQRAVLRYQECQVGPWHRCQGRYQLRMHRDQQSSVGFLLAHRDDVASYVLPSHPQAVALALRRVEAQGERQSRLAANRMTLLELCDSRSQTNCDGLRLGCDIF
jgi:hypothetical protein